MTEEAKQSRSFAPLSDPAPTEAWLQYDPGTAASTQTIMSALPRCSASERASCSCVTVAMVTCFNSGRSRRKYHPMPSWRSEGKLPVK